MTKKVFTFRHSLKLKTTNNSKWEKSDRYKENSFDTPLAPTGFKNAKRVGLELIKQHKNGIIDLTKTKYRVIYNPNNQFNIQKHRSNNK
jgi:hypothetical protein